METLTFPSHSCPPSTHHRFQIISRALQHCYYQSHTSELGSHSRCDNHTTKPKKVPGEKAKHQTRMCSKSFAHLHLPQGRADLFLSSGLESLCNSDCISPEEHLPKLPCLGLQDGFTQLGQAPHDHDGITCHDWCLSVLKDKKGEGVERQDVKNKFATGSMTPKSW